MGTGADEAWNASGMAAAAAILANDVSAEEVTAEFLRRIDEVNPNIGAMRQVLANEALAQAREIDSRRGHGEALGPLAGLPVAIKENCDTRGAVCSAGLAFRRNHVPPKDSSITERLRAAGTIVLGVTTSDPGAFDVRTLDVTHPIRPELTVGGSSGGSAAALAAKMCLGAIGTDTGGSIRIPSACCGTAGLKPTFGSLPMEGIFPLVQSLDHVGPMGRTVGDVELLWNSLAPHKRDPDNTPRTLGFDPKYVAEADEKIRNDFQTVIDRCRKMGKECLEVDLPDLDDVVTMHGRIFVVEAARYHTTHHGRDLERYPEIAQRFFQIANDLAVADQVDAFKKRVEYTKRTNDLFRQVDLFLTPTIAIHEPLKSAAKLTISGRSHDYTMALVRHTCLFNHTGHPALAMPVAPRSDGLPSSIQIVGGYGQEAGLLSFGKELEGQPAGSPLCPNY